ncbi:MAG: Golgi apparatus membrane protein tvp18 [Phylliscum demangeonii]|nr:MAG: Golgi apparatus membrane protein tvp18 [Phylliscum demangeonii]
MADFQTIATQFVQFYYNTFDANRQELSGLYRGQSMLTFENVPVQGSAAIVEKLTSFPFQKIAHKVTTLDSQPTGPEGGIVVMVTGELQVDDEQKPMNYTQTFHLVPEAGSYYVLNDMFRLVTGVLCIIICFALGIANIFHLHLVILFSVICLVCSFVLVFIEIPLLLRICPTSSKFDSVIRKVTTNYMRAGVYLVMSIVQWLSLLVKTTSLIVPAVLLLIAAVFYALAGLKGQGFVGSKTLGGQGVAQMIV